jgi:hypothetical protein
LVGNGKIGKTVPFGWSLSGERLCCGYDGETPVSDLYQLPFKFTGASSAWWSQSVASHSTSCPKKWRTPLSCSNHNSIGLQTCPMSVLARHSPDDDLPVTDHVTQVDDSDVRL